MSAYKDDLDKISNVLFAFFRNKRISDSLTSFHELEITGWEKWWQTELALFLSQADGIADWVIEHPFDVDGRSRSSKLRMSLDIGFRLKHHSTSDWHFVELKQDNDYKRCIEKMCTDADKVFTARTRSFDNLGIRFIACAGVFLDIKDDDEVIEYVMDAYGSDLGDEDIRMERVGKHHSLLVF